MQLRVVLPMNNWARMVQPRFPHSPSTKSMHVRFFGAKYIEKNISRGLDLYTYFYLTTYTRPYVSTVSGRSICILNSPSVII